MPKNKTTENEILIEVWSHYPQSHTALILIFLEAKPDTGFKRKYISF